MERKLRPEEIEAVEFMSGRIMDLFHDYRIEKVGKNNPDVEIDGLTLNGIIIKAKKETKSTK